MQMIVAPVCFTLARIVRALQVPFHWCDGWLLKIETRLTLWGSAAWGKGRAE